MKKAIFFPVLMIVALSFYTNQTFAQDISSYNDERPLPKYLLRSAAANYPKVTLTVLQVFKRDFADAKDVEWSLVGNNYQARFIQNDRKTRILFDPKGHILYSISYGTLKSLPADIRKTVRSIYYDYDIMYVAEVHSYSKTAWFLSLEDETSLVTVKVIDGQVIKTGNFHKSK